MQFRDDDLTCFIVAFSILLLIWTMVFFSRSSARTLSSSDAEADERGRAQRRRDRWRRDVYGSYQPTIRRHRNGGGVDRDGVGVRCAETMRFCTSDRDCEIMCNDGEPTRCDTAVTRTCAILATPSVSHDRDNGDGSRDKSGETKCDTKGGEYAMLIGYSSIGAALWQCVQLYRHFADRATFCEGGEFEMNAELREPSYRDCACPPDTVRMIKRLAVPYDIRLPHCVPKAAVHFYEMDMIATDDDDNAVVESQRRR